MMRRLQQLRSKLPWEHTCIHTEGASLAGVVGSIYTRLVLATSSNSPQAQNLLTYSGLQVPLCPVVSIFSWKERCLPRKTQKPCRSSPCFSLLFGNICWIIEKATEFQKNIYFCFIDYSKAFAEKAMAPHFSTLAWKTLWTEESGRLQSMGSQKVGHD